ncbi:MAG: hypothetical protein ACE5E5_02450 [Phycisphaerae bacterium]
MNFLKRHLFYIVCAVGALGGIALAVTGLRAQPKVLAELGKAKGVYTALDRLATKPVNARIIDAKSKNIGIMLDDSQRVLQEAEKLYGYEPLVEGVFPNGDNDARFRFMVRYNEAMAELMDSLRWGTPATASDINLMAERIEREILRANPQGLDEGATADAPAPSGPAYTPAGVLTRSGAKDSAEVRAHIQKALTMNCYATLKSTKKTRTGTQAGPSVSLQFSPWMANTKSLEPPLMSDVWWAHVQYWIQKDVVEAINAVNEEAGDASVAGGGLRWVGIMPVKEIISVRVSSGFILDDDDYFVGAPPGGYEEALPCATRNTVFTNSQSGPTYDVLQFTLKLVMDERDILKLVDRICKDRFHTLLRVAYTAVPPNRYIVGKIYGSEPTVNVVLDFETIMLPSVFHKWMPQEVCDEYDHIVCPDRSQEEEG